MKRAFFTLFYYSPQYCRGGISVLCTVYCVLCTVYCVLCTVYCVLCTVYCVLCTVYCVLCTVYCVLCTVYCVLCTVYCVLCTVYCVLCTVYCVLCTVYCVLCTVYCAEIDQKRELVHFVKLTPPLAGRIPKMQMPVLKSSGNGTSYPILSKREKNTKKKKHTNCQDLDQEEEDLSP